MCVCVCVFVPGQTGFNSDVPSEGAANPKAMESGETQISSGLLHLFSSVWREWPPSPKKTRNKGSLFSHCQWGSGTLMWI